MKKIIPLFLLAVFLVSIVLPCVPVSAADEPEYGYLYGTYEANPVLTMPSSSLYGGSMPSGTAFTDLGQEILYFQLYTDSVSVSYTTGGQKTFYSLDEGWLDTGMKVITFEKQYKPKTQLYEWFIANYTRVLPKCDGSSCSWADDDYDGICDTCGGQLFAFRYDLLQYASEQIVHALGTWPNAIHWFISETGEDDELWAYISESPFVYENGVLSTPVMSYWATFSFNQQGRPVSSGWSHINANSPLVYYELVDSSANIDGLFPPTGGDTGSGTGGTTPPSGDDTESDGILDGLRDIFTGMLDNLKGIAKGITDLPSLIGDKIGEAFNTVKDGILEGIKSIFIPDAQEIETKFLGFVEDVGIILGANFDAFDSLFEVEKPLEDVYVDYTIPGLGDFHLKILEKEWIHKGVAFFRPVIRGWLMFLLVIFVWNNTLGLIRQAMPIAPSTPTETESITVSKSEKLSNGWTKTTSRSTRSKRR